MTGKVTPALSGPSLTDREVEAMDRIDRVRGIGGMKAALLALMLSPSLPGRLRIWREETAVVPEAEAIRADVDQLGPTTRLPWFELLLARMGVINPDTMAEKRPYIILFAFIVAAIITPPDVFSQFFLAVPMIILFEVGLFVARRMKRAADAAVDSGRRDLTDAEIESEFKKHDEAFSGKK